MIWTTWCRGRLGSFASRTLLQLQARRIFCEICACQRLGTDILYERRASPSLVELMRSHLDPRPARNAWATDSVAKIAFAQILHLQPSRTRSPAETGRAPLEAKACAKRVDYLMSCKDCGWQSFCKDNPYDCGASPALAELQRSHLNPRPHGISQRSGRRSLPIKEQSCCAIQTVTFALGTYVG